VPTKHRSRETPQGICAQGTSEAEAATDSSIPVLTAPPAIPAPAGKPAAATKLASKIVKPAVAPQPLVGMTFCIIEAGA
jgi:hypothetical protein